MKHPITMAIFLVLIFFLSQLAGLLIVKEYLPEKTGEAPKDLPYSIERPESGPSSVAYIITAIIAGTLILFLLMRYRKKTLWKVWYFLAVWISLSIAFSAFINSKAALFTSFFLSVWKTARPNIYVHNLTEIFVYAGIAAIFVPVEGFSITAAIVLLAVISLYDIYAVNHSKHMIKLAKFQAESNVFAGFFIPYKNKKIEEKSMAKKEKKQKDKKIRTALLGGGDVAFPLIFTGVVMKQFGMLAFIIPIFTTLALAYLLWQSQKGKFYPAMPYLTVGCLVGYGIVLLV